MLRTLCFQCHWLLGITAGVVLAVVGATGAMLSFEEELLHAMNGGVMTVVPKDAPALEPPALLERIQRAHPGQPVTAFTVSHDKSRSVRVVFGRDPARYFDPYTGNGLGTPRGASAFRSVRSVHRWLAAGELGKQIVGASTIALIISCLTGLYLRWPRHPRSWRAWLAIDFSRKGRSFLWDLHAVLGTWVLIPYLLAGLTGLHWSYDWYRDGLFALTGTTRPTRQVAANGRQPVYLQAAWVAFRAEAGGFSTATLRMPASSSQPVQITYLDRSAAHERAFNRVWIDPASGTVVAHERYADKALGAKLMSSMLALHSGSFFGLPGVIALMLASLLMPLFAITGWILYLHRRGRRRALLATA